VVNHGDCVSPQFDLSNHPLEGIRFLKLSERSLLLLEDRRPEKYACLSHCRGSGKDILKTEQASLRAHLDTGIAVDELPRTFQDVVDICQRLDVKYLWIDSLCIIQDSDEDWRAQSARMGDIYENARFTIAASASNAPTEGCYRTTSGHYRGEPVPGHTGVYVRCQPRRPKRFNTPLWPLLRRAWAFQELSLSPRVVHYAADDIV
jgi:hypothetical protein